MTYSSHQNTAESLPLMARPPCSKAGGAAARWCTALSLSLSLCQNQKAVLAHLFQCLKSPVGAFLCHLIPPSQANQQPPCHILCCPEVQHQENNHQHKVCNKATAEEPAYNVDCQTGKLQAGTVSFSTSL